MQVTNVAKGGGEKYNPSLSSYADVLVLDQGGVEHISAQAFNATTGELLGAVPKLDQVLPGHVVRYSISGNTLTATKPLLLGEGSALWSFTASAGEKILSITPRPATDPVASIGKVLGDRRVLYKFLSPNLALLITGNDGKKTASVYVLDTLTGGILFSNVHTNIDLDAPISAVMSENWFAYSFTSSPSTSSSSTSQEQTKGHHLVVGEMFESLIANDRGASSGNSSAARTTSEPVVLTASFQIPEPISKLGVTQTRQGITSRHLLAVLGESAGVVGIPYAVLDPRRPVDRDANKVSLYHPDG